MKPSHALVWTITRAISRAEPILHDRLTRHWDKRRSGERKRRSASLPPPPACRAFDRHILVTATTSQEKSRGLVDVFSKVDEDLRVNEDGGPENTSADRQGPESKENLQ